MVIYAYAIIGLMLFASNDPAHFGNVRVLVLIVDCWLSPAPTKYIHTHTRAHTPLK